jgi:hypothetical protein
MNRYDPQPLLKTTDAAPRVSIRSAMGVHSEMLEDLQDELEKLQGQLAYVRQHTVACPTECIKANESSSGLLDEILRSNDRLNILIGSVRSLSATLHL